MAPLHFLPPSGPYNPSPTIGQDDWLLRTRMQLLQGLDRLLPPCASAPDQNCGKIRRIWGRRGPARRSFVWRLLRKLNSGNCRLRITPGLRLHRAAHSPDQTMYQ